MNALEPMQTVFHFIFKEAGGGGGGGGEITPASAQTGDWLSVLIAILFAVIALCLTGYFIYNRKTKRQVTGSHVVAKSTVSAKMIAIGVAIVLAIGGCIFSFTNAPLLRAFANGTANADMDYGTDINVYVYEETQTIEFETGNYFTNLTDTPIHIDSSKLTLSEEAKALGIPDFEFKATYENNQTDVFAGEPDQVDPDVPTEQTALATNATQNIKYSTNMTYETAKLLSTLENAFTLELTETPCYTIQYDANGATSGEVPASETLSLSTEEGALNINAVAPENTGNLEKSSGGDNAFRFIGWNTKKDGTGTYYKPGETIPGSESAKVGETVPLYVEWELGYNVTFQADDFYDIQEVNSVSNGTFTKFIPNTHESGKFTTYAVSTDVATLNYLTFTWKDIEQNTVSYTVKPVQKVAGHNFEKWLINGESFPLAKNLSQNSTFSIQSKEALITLTYKVVDENYPHGSVSLNSTDADEGDENDNALVAKVTETFRPGVTPKGAAAVADSSTFNYEFINWTKEGTDITYETASFVPSLEKEGIAFFSDATYVVHFAAPKAIVQKDDQEKITMHFVYDDEEYPELTNLQKFPVNNTKIDINNLANTEFPSWFTPADFNKDGKLTVNPSPIVNPNKVIIDPTFKKYKGLTSTAMWFMDTRAFSALISLLNGPSNDSYNNFHNGYYENTVAAPMPQKSSRILESVEGLENIYLDNLQYMDLMFANGANLANLSGGGSSSLQLDTLTSLDLSSWVSSTVLKDNSMMGMFAGCNGLTNLVFPQTTAEKKYAIGDTAVMFNGIFAGCSSLQTLNFNKNFGSNARNLGYAFAGASKLIELDFDATDDKALQFGKNANSIQFFAALCPDLRILNMKNMSGEKITSPDAARNSIYNDKSLIKFVINDNWTVPYKSMDPGYSISDSWWQYTPSGQELYTKWSSDAIPEQSGGGTFTRDSAKAVYVAGTNSTNATFTFYYDHEIHTGNKEFSIPLSSSESLVTSTEKVFPDWYEATASINNNTVDLNQLIHNTSLNSLIGADIEVEIHSNLPSADCDVVFDSSFRNCDNLRKMHYWFVADSDGNAPFVSFSGFGNIPTDDLDEVSDLFGGVSVESMLCRVVPGYEYQIAVLADTNFITNCDTYNTKLSSIDLSDFNFPQWHGMFANATALEQVTLPSDFKPKNLAFAFFNCKSLKTITNLNLIDTKQCYCFTRMFSGCSSLKVLDLSHFNTVYLGTYYNNNLSAMAVAVHGMFSGCFSLQEFTIPSDNGSSIDPSWGVFMKYADLPDDYGTFEDPTDDNPWIAENFGNKPLFSIDIPWKDSEVSHDTANHVYGKFTRNEPTTTRTISVSKTPDAGGTISPSVSSIEVRSDVRIAVYKDTLVVNGTEYKPTPNEHYIFSEWQINDERIQPSHFYSNIKTIGFNDAAAWENGVEIKAVFINENLKPRAVYKTNQMVDGNKVNTLTYYYDDNEHEEGDAVFIVNNKTGIDTSNEMNVTCVMPDWYDYTFTFDINKIMSGGNGFGFNCKWKIDPSCVIFDSSFKEYQALESISMWWMADHDNYQPVERFYSPAQGQQPSSANEGFANLYSSNISNMTFAFGGFWLEMNDSFSSLYADMLQTYGRGIQHLDVSSLDFSSVKDMSFIFANCLALQDIKLGENFDSSQVTSMEGLFYNCETLGINSTDCGITNFSKLSTKNVTDFSYMFFGCCNIKELDLTNFNMDSATNNDPYYHVPSAKLMFYDCTRLHKLTFNTEVRDGVPYGWTLIFGNNNPDDVRYIGEGLGGLKDNYDASGNVQTWKDVDGNEYGSLNIPWEYGKYSYWSPLAPEDVHSGTFTREAPTDKTVNFVAGENGLVNDKPSDSYKFIQSAKITVDESDPSVLWADNYKLTATPNNQYKLQYWTFDDTWGELAGKRVNQETLDNLGPIQENGHGFKAVFIDKKWSAKALYTVPESNSTVGHMKFVYDDQEHADTDSMKVYEIEDNFNDYNYPSWYADSGYHFAGDIDDHIVPTMDSFILNSGATNITVEIDSTFENYTSLSSLSCWFMPGLSANASSLIYFGEIVNDKMTFVLNGANYINTSNVTNVKYMFGGMEFVNDINGSCIQKIDLSHFDDGEHLSNLEGLFANCSYLENIVWEHQKQDYGAAITNFKKLFYNCRKLTGNSLAEAMSTVNFSGASDISYMFGRYYFDPTEVEVEDEITYNFGNIALPKNSVNAEGLFAGVSTAKKIIIIDSSGAQTSSIISYKYAFKDCINLETVDFSQSTSLSTADTSDLSYMFSGCSKLNNASFISDVVGSKNLIITSKTKSLAYMFENCESLKNFEVAGCNVGGVQTMEGMFYGSGLETFEFQKAFKGSDYTNVLNNMSYMFYNCEQMQTVKMNRDATGVQEPIRGDMRFMFANCSVLVDADLRGINILRKSFPAGMEKQSGCLGMFAFVNNSGTWLCNSTIASFAIDNKWDSEMGETGLILWTGQTEMYWEGSTQKPPEDVMERLVSWYKKEDVVLTPYPIIQIGSDIQGSFTHEEPYSLSLEANNTQWGIVTLGTKDLVTYNYYDEIQFALNSDNSVKVTYRGAVTNINYKTLAESTFDKWTYKDDDGVEHDLTSTPVTFTGSDNNAIIPNFKDGNLLIAKYDSDENGNGSLTIGVDRYNDEEQNVWPVNVDGYSESSLPEWHEYASSINSVVFMSNMKDVASVRSMAYWFKDCENLLNIDLSILNYKFIAEYTSMFENCKNIKKVDFPEGDYKADVKLDKLFKGCTSLESFSLGFMESASSYTEMVSGCPNIQYLYFYSLNINMGNAGLVQDDADWLLFQNSQAFGSYLCKANDVKKVNSQGNLYIRTTNKINASTSDPVHCLFGDNKRGYYSSIELGINPSIGLTASFECWDSPEDNILVRMNFKPAYNYRCRDSYTNNFEIYLQPWVLKEFDSEYMKTGVTLNGDILSPYASGKLNANDQFVFLSDTRKYAKAVLSDDGKFTFKYTTEPVLSGEYNVEYGHWEWDSKKSQITQIEFEESFANYNKLSNVNNWFSGCTNLLTVSGLQNINFGKVNDMAFMFSECSQVQEINFGNNEIPSSVYTYQNFCSNCTELTKVVMNGASADSSTYLEGMFSSCNKLSDVTFGENWKQVITIGESQDAYYMNQTTGATFQNGHFPYEGTSGYGQFVKVVPEKKINVKVDENHGSLIGISVLYFDETHPAYYQVRDNGFGANYLYIQIRNSQTSNDDYFEQEVIAYPNYGYAVDKWYLGDNEISVGQDWAKIENYSNDLRATFKEQANNGAKVVYNSNEKSVEFVYDSNAYSEDYYKVIPDVPAVTNESRSAFDDIMKRDATSVTFAPSFIQYKNATEWMYFFLGFNNLQSISGFENLCTDNLRSVKHMFEATPASLTTLNLDGFHLTGKNIIDGIDASYFINNTQLKYVNFNGSNFSKVTNMESFCTSNYQLISVDAIQLNTSSVMTMNNMFSNNANLESVLIRDEDGNTSWDNTKCLDYSQMFYQDYKLQKLDLSFLCFYEIKSPYARSVVNLCSWCSELKEIDASGVRGEYKVFQSCEGTWYWASECNQINKISLNECIKSSIFMIFGSDLRNQWIDEDNNEIDIHEETSPGTYYTFSKISFKVNDPDAGKISSEEPIIYLDASMGETVSYTTDQNSIAITVWNSEGTPLHTYTRTATSLLPEKYTFVNWVVDTDEEGTITGNTTIVAYFKDSVTAAAYYYEADIAAGKPSRLVFYYDTDDHSDAKYKFDINKELNYDKGEFQLWNKDPDSEIGREVTNAESIIIDSSFANYKGLRNLDRFFRCMQFKELTGLEYIDTQKVTSTREMFQLCNGFEGEFDVSKLDISNVKNISSMFSDMQRASAIKFVDENGYTRFDTSNVTNLYWLFAGCNHVNSFDLSSFVFNKKIETCRYMFAYCSDLRSVNMQNFFVGYWDEAYQYETDCSEMFMYASNVRQFTVGEYWQKPFAQTGISDSTGIYEWTNESGESYYLPYWETLRPGTYSPRENVNLNSSNSVNQSSSQADPVDPQVDPVVDPTRETEGDDNSVPFTLAALAMGPALAALGFRKRIRGKHVKL